MELHRSARRRPGGAVTITRWARSCAFLYGPHLRLASGRYRLRFRCEVRHARRPSRPVLGVEVIAQNRVLLRWRDFTLDELAGGELGCSELGGSELGGWELGGSELGGSERGSGELGSDELGGMGGVVEFEVPPDRAGKTGVDAPLEFRFLDLVNATLPSAPSICRQYKPTTQRPRPRTIGGCWGDCGRPGCGIWCHAGRSAWSWTGRKRSDRYGRSCR